MKRARGCLMVAFIFACGFLVGGFLGAAMGWIGFFHKVVKGGPGAVREVVIERVSKDLKLKPEQAARVRQIVDETGSELNATTAEVRPKVAEILGRNAARIREVLDTEQREKFDRFLLEGRRRWQAAAAARAAATPAPKVEAQPPAPAPQ